MCKKNSLRNFILYSLLSSVLLIGGCGSAEYVNGTAALQDSKETGSSSVSSSVDAEGTNDSSGQSGSDSSTKASADTSETASATTQDSSGPGSRDNTSVCLVAEHPGVSTCGNELVTIDSSNSSYGYICVNYTGSCQKVKLQITCPNTTTYTYNLSGGYETFPLTTDSGTYSIGVFENITDTQYSTAYKANIDVSISDQYGPYLYPNQYVNFKEGDLCVLKGEELAYSANKDLDVVTNVYNYMIENVSYDAAFASTVESGYLPTPDNTLATGKGICLDYAALMASMLRSQRIPTHMEVGYAGTSYHAWISVYLEETGWVNGIIEFNGTSWELMDPTFAASASESELKEFIGDGSNYETKYIY